MKKIVFTTARVQRKPVAYRAIDGTGYAYYVRDELWMVSRQRPLHLTSFVSINSWEPIYEGDSLTITF